MVPGTPKLLLYPILVLEGFDSERQIDPRLTAPTRTVLQDRVLQKTLQYSIFFISLVRDPQKNWPNITIIGVGPPLCGVRVFALKFHSQRENPRARAARMIRSSTSTLLPYHTTSERAASSHEIYKLSLKGGATISRGSVGTCQ